MEIPTNPDQLLGQALRAMLREEVKEGIAQALAEVVPQLMRASDPTEMVNVPEAARRLGLSVSKTRRLIRARELGGVRSGRRCLVPTTAIDTYITRLQGQQLRLPLDARSAP